MHIITYVSKSQEGSTPTSVDTGYSCKVHLLIYVHVCICMWVTQSTSGIQRTNCGGQFSFHHVRVGDLNSGGYAWHLYLLSHLGQTYKIFFISKCRQMTIGSFGLDIRIKLHKQCEFPQHWFETHLQANFIHTNINKTIILKNTFLQ